MKCLDNMWFPQTNLDPTVSPIGNDDVSVGVHGHARRSVELSVPFSMGTELKQELPVCVVHLQERSQGTLCCHT